MTPADLARHCRETYTLPPTFVEGDTEARLTSWPGNVTVIDFRGTTFDGWDILQDLRALPWWSSELGCFVHHGFLKGVQGIWPLMADTISQIRGPLIFIGHSKGAGETAICAAFTKKLLGKTPALLETFGAPRIGLQGFCDITRGIPGNRWVNGIDIVTTVPPPGQIIRYRHDRPAMELHYGEPHRTHNHRIKDYELGVQEGATLPENQKEVFKAP